MTGTDPQPSIRNPSPKPINPPGKRGLAPFVLTFLIMALFWVVLSGKFDPFHLSLGAISCLMVAALGKDLFFPAGVNPLKRPGTVVTELIRHFVRGILHRQIEHPEVPYHLEKAMDGVPRRIAMVGLTQFVSVVAGFFALGASMKMWGYPDKVDPFIRWRPTALFLREKRFSDT